MTIRVVIADDQAIVREGLRMIIEAQHDLEVAGEAADGSKTVDICLSEQPDVVLMDVRMPGVDGIEATRQLASRAPVISVLVLTTFGDDAVVADGDEVLDPSIVRRLVAGLRPEHPSDGGPPPRLKGLTDREHEVLGLVVRGRSNREIGAELFLGEATVKTHVAAILRKTGCRDRLQLVVLGYELGLVRPGEAG